MFGKKNHWTDAYIIINGISNDHVTHWFYQLKYEMFHRENFCGFDMRYTLIIRKLNPV